MSTCERGTSTRRGRAAGVVVAVVGLALTSFPAPARADTAEVTIANMAFSPQTVTVAMTEGEEDIPDLHAHVNFVMRDEGVEHTVSFDDRSVAVGSSGRLSAGQTYTVIFEEPGTFQYRCEIHPNMTGTVVVTSPHTASHDESKPQRDADESGTSTAILVVVAALAAGTGLAAFLLVRRRRSAAGSGPPGRRPTRPGGS